MNQKSQQQPSQIQNESRLSVITVQRKKQELLRINADDYSTKHLVIFWAIYILIIILVSVLTLALPPTFIGFSNRDTTYKTDIQNCENPIGFNSQNLVYCNPTSSSNPVSGLLLRDLSAINQFVLVYMNFVLNNTALSYLQFQDDIQISFYSLQTQNAPNHKIQFKKEQEIQKQQMSFSIKSYQASRIYEDNGFVFKGYRKLLGYQKQISSENSLVMFKFKEWPINNVKEVYMDFVTITSQFTVFSIVIRYIFFAISIATTIFFYLRYRVIPQNQRTLEQKMVFYLSIFTIMFNDPLYAITIMAPNGFTAFVSVAFVVNFVTFLVAFWMIFIDRIYYQTGPKHQNVLTKKKYAYFVLLYIVFFMLQFQLALYRINDEPIIPIHDFTSGKALAFQIIATIVFIFGLSYIAVQFARSLPHFCNKLWRNQMFLMFSFLYIVILIVMVFINGFSIYEYVGSRILVLYTFMNMYTIYIQYMYSITSNQVKKLETDILTGKKSGNQIETIISNFGNEDIIVDLDSEVDYQQNYPHKNEYRINKYENALERLDSKEQNHQEQQTHQYLHQENKEKKKQFDTFQLED